MKKLFLIIFLTILLLPSFALAYNTYQTSDGKTVIYKGLVPCGKPVYFNGNLTDEGDIQGIDDTSGCCITPCTFCHFFVMLDGIIDFILFDLVPPIAILMLVIAGIMYIGGIFEFVPGGFQTISQGKRIFTSVIIGLIVVYSAWTIITMFFSFIGISDTGPFKELAANPKNWAVIECPMVIEKCSGRLVEENCMDVRANGKIPCASEHADKSSVEYSECEE